MYYGKIKKIDIADGEGVRVSLFVSGCTNACEGCFQKETWNFLFGKKYTQETEEEIIEALKPDYIDGFTALGGEPFEFVNQIELTKLFRRIRQELPHKSIWSYTGFIYEKDLVPGGRRYGEYTEEMLSYIDVLIDGPFILCQKNLNLPFRGSQNQRIIDMKKTREKKEVVLYLP